MKRIAIIACALLSCFNIHAQITENATTAVSNMGVGWNLGNTLDASKHNAANPDIDSYWNCQGVDSETYWGQYTTTAGVFTMLKEAGFGAVRIPVTWYNHMDKNGKVNAQWMARVRTVVDYAINSGLYCIINVHHDTGADGTDHTSWIKADEANYTKNKERYEYLWKQIAEEFKDYDKHLLFEGYNEMLDIKSSWCFASFAAQGQYDATIAASAYNAINNYAQSFVNSVRATGGNNATRNLIVSTYAAACGTGSWNSHLKDPLTKLNLPQDDVAGHIIFEVHSYPSIANKNSNGTTTSRNINTIKQETADLMNTLKNYLASKGAPVIIGEWGTSNVDAGAGKTDYDERRSLMMQFADDFVKKAKENNIGTFYWMGLTDGIYRTLPAFNQADLAECITKAYHGSDFNGKYPEPEEASSYECFNGDKLLSWGNGITIPAALFKNMSADVILRLTYKQEANSNEDIQFYYGDWSVLVPSFVGTKSYSGDFNPRAYYNTGNGTQHVTDFTFSEATYNTLSQKGLIVHGNGVRLYKAELLLPNAAGIETVTIPLTTNAIYNLSGQRLATPRKGINIINGKKVMVK